MGRIMTLVVTHMAATYIRIYSQKNKANQCRLLGNNENPVNTAADKKQVMEFSTTE